MKEIQLREARATLSAVIEAAENGEPTTITKHGRPAAVIVSHGEWTRLKTRVASFADLLLDVPRLDPDDLPKRRPPVSCARDDDALFLSVITLAEMQAGISRLERKGASKRAADLSLWLSATLELYQSRTLPIASGTALET